MKEFIQYCKQFNSQKVLKVLHDMDEKQTLELFSHLFTLFDGIIFTHDIKKRKTRNQFFETMLTYCVSSQYTAVLLLLRNKIQIVLCAEKLFDKIKLALTSTKLASYSPAIQCWSQVIRLEKELATIITLSHEASKKGMKPDDVYNMSRKLKIEYRGIEVQPDFQIESLLSSLALSLTLIAHQNKWFNDDNELIFPIKPELDNESVEHAAHEPSLAMMWQKLMDVSLRCLLFDGKVRRVDEGSLDGKVKERGITEVFHFVPEYSNFERHDFIAAHRLTDRSIQHFFEAAVERNLEGLIVNDIDEIKSIDEDLFLSENEVLSLEGLAVLYCEDVRSNKTEYQGLTLRQWVRGYACLDYIVSQSGDYANGRCYKESELVSFFERSGLSPVKSQVFIKMVTFGKQSRDFFDKPLLKLQNGSYYLFHPVFRGFSISGVLTSVFSQLEVEIKSKGKKFEESILNKLHRANILAKAFKFKRNNDEYEYDAVFIMDKRVFVVECKNRSIARWNAVRGARFKKFLQDTAKQVKRLVDGIQMYPEVFREHFAKEITDFEVIPLIINCLPFSYSGRFDGVYVSDTSSFGTFLGSGVVEYREYAGKENKVCNERALHYFWNGDQPCSDDLIRHLENPVHLEVYHNNIETLDSWLYADKETLFTVRDLQVDVGKGMEIKFGI